jgi:hypothetical protein
MRYRVIKWENVPWSLWAFEGILLVNLIVIEAAVSAPAPALIVALFFVPIWAYALLARLRWVWICTLALFVASIPEVVLGSVPWEGSVLTGVGLVLLLLPTTRHYFAKRAESRLP